MAAWAAQMAPELCSSLLARRMSSLSTLPPLKPLSFLHTDSDLHRRPSPRVDALSTYLSFISILAKDKNHWGAREQGDD